MPVLIARERTNKTRGKPVARGAQDLARRKLREAGGDEEPQAAPEHARRGHLRRASCWRCASRAYSGGHGHVVGEERCVFHRQDSQRSDANLS